MKKRWTFLFLIALTHLTSFSLTTSNANGQELIQSYQIDAETIKYANIIFAEHSKLLKENKLLYEEIDYYNRVVSNYNKIDSIQNSEILNLRNVNFDNQNTINNLENSLKKRDRKIKAWQIGSITVSVALLVLFLIK